MLREMDVALKTVQATAQLHCTYSSILWSIVLNKLNSDFYVLEYSNPEM